MDYSSIIDFSPGSPARKIISEEFKDAGYSPFREWFFQSFDKQEMLYFQDEFYKVCKEKNALIPFVTWFIDTYVKNYISVIERNYKLESRKVYQGFFILKRMEKFIIFQPFLN